MKNSKVGRNDPCPCGSGNKYKKCCLVMPISDSEEYNPEPPIKISEAIIKIAEPLMKKYQDKKRWIVFLDLAVIAWNLSCSNNAQREELESVLIKVMPKEIDAVGTVTLLEKIDQLIERKNKLYPDINYLIVDQKISVGDNGDVNVDISFSFIKKIVKN